MALAKQRRMVFPLPPMDQGPRIRDRETLDTSTSPLKNTAVMMEVDRDASKRPNMDIAGDATFDSPNNPQALLAITDDSGKDHRDLDSPISSSSSSKRVKL
ncbi:hypothetical protein D1007_52754 [Hordeum vulgare]|nr:hypothetical protein D1007_52754 [Hordeum vulgare]